MDRIETIFSGFPPIDAGRWKERVLEELKGADYTKIIWKTPEGFDMEPWYNRHTALPAPALPFVRSSNRWSICQQITITRLAADPSLITEALAGGANAIECHIDDAGGDSLETDTLFEALRNLRLDEVPLYFSGAIPEPSALLEKLLELPGFSANTGAILCDTISGQHEPSLPPEPLQRSGFRTLTVDTVRFHNAGATIAQELAIALAGAGDLLERLTDKGIPATEASAAIVFVVAAGTSHFPELAKLRALRAMWPQLLAAWGVATENMPEPRLFVRASIRSFSVLDPFTNILRLSTEALSAILGGCDALQLASFDPAGSASHEFTDRITRNIHLLLRDEAGLGHVVDPAAGSWYIETMTATLCREAWKLFRQIEAAGGLGAAEATGALTAMIAPAAEARQKAVNTRRRTLVGINRYTVPPSAEVTASMKNHSGSGAATGYEQLRQRMLFHATAGGTTPRAALWLHGDPSKSLRVAAFAEDFLRSGGFEVLPAVTLDPITCNCRAALRDEPDIVVLCWSGDEDSGKVTAICTTIQELRKETVIVMAAKPPENADALIEAGLDRFIHTGSDAYADLLSLQHKTGVL